jgi:hypothetical protein
LAFYILYLVGRVLLQCPSRQRASSRTRDGERRAAPGGLRYAAGDLRRPQQAPGQPHLDQAAAVPTYGVLQVPSEEPLFTNEIETDSGEATQPPASSDTQAASTVTTGVMAGASLQQEHSNTCNVLYMILE